MLNIFVCQDPEYFINQQQALLLAGAEDESVFALQFLCDQYYLAEPQAIALVALVHLQKKPSGLAIGAAILPLDGRLAAAIEDLLGTAAELKPFAREQRAPWLDLSAPLLLDPVKIPKPWGREIWYTGIEARGQSNVMAQGLLTPLPWVLALMPNYLAAGCSKKIILLKTLDPLPDEIYGDLYFELHEQKQEVYIVTHIDPQAWPAKQGEMRLGFAAEKLSQFATQDVFKAAYLTAVGDYEIIRRKIDHLLDIECDKRGLNPPLEVAKLSELMLSMPEDLRLQERQARASMNSFSAVLPLRVGDVVKVPCYVPHALQHGVRTIELQTPVYERKILSFAQKVLTQPHWDTQAAMETVALVAPEQKALGILSSDAGVLVEEVVKFADFRVIRINLGAAQEYRLKPQNSYGLLLAIGSGCSIISEGGALDIAAEVAVFVPRQLFAHGNTSPRLKAGDTPVQILLADIMV